MFIYIFVYSNAVEHGKNEYRIPIWYTQKAYVGVKKRVRTDAYINGMHF